MQRLKDEQENFERKIQQLEQQNVLIAQERETILFIIRYISSLMETCAKDISTPM